MNSQWEKIGDFNQIHNIRRDVPLNRQVIFKSRFLDNPVKEFTLCGYRNGGFQIIAKARNTQSYEQLRQAVVQPGIEEPEFYDSDMNIIRLRTSHLGLIGNFLNAIESIEPRFESVKQEVCTTLGLNLNQTQHYRQPQLLVFPRVPHLPMHNFPPRTRVNPLISFIQNLLTEAAMNASFENSHPSAPSLPPPNVGINENRVEELQKRYESKHKSQIEIPEKFLCALMNIVMTTPVSVPQTPDVRFEQSQILHWLASNPSHPLTRAPLNPQQLVVDANLQQEIEKFINEKEKKLSEPTVEPITEPTLEPTVEPIVHTFKRRTRTIQLERLTAEANHFIGGELPAKRKRISRIAH